MLGILPLLNNIINDLTITVQLLENECVFVDYFKINKKERKLIFKYIQYKYIINDFHEKFKIYEAEKA